jgi:acyl-coenzyme A thioesterase PaaI-like protein
LLNAAYGSGVTDAEHYHKLERLYAAAPISQWYGATIAVAEGQAEVRIATRPEFHHAAHAVHGSVYFRALDDAAFFAVNSRVREVLVLTVSFTVHFAGQFRGASCGRWAACCMGVGACFWRKPSSWTARGSYSAGAAVFTRSAIPLDPTIGYA